MALKQLILSKKMESKRAALAELEEAGKALETRRAEMQTREAEIEAALNEVTEQTPDEERQTVEAEVERFEAESTELNREEQENAEQRAAVEAEIRSIENELAEINQRANAHTDAHKAEIPTVERKDEYNMITRNVFGNMNIQQRNEMIEREDVKNFLQRAREMGMQERAVTGKELLIPDVILGLIRDNTAQASKLLKHVNHRRVGGTSRVVVAGVIPEAVWTEMCGKLNEMNIGFYGEEMDGWKVGGYIAVCKAALEDSDIELAAEIIDSISKALGYGLDKAICYGTGNKMPLGIVTRLTQVEEPANYSAKARPWQNLSTTNVQSISSKTGLDLFKAMKVAMAAAKGHHATGGRFWAMNESTRATLEAEAMSLTATGAFATGMVGATMPNPMGGAIETLDFIPDGIVIGGYGELYYVAERAGVELSTSEHVRFIEDQVVYKGTARYDGKPVIAEGFVAFGINGKKPTAGDVSFALDKANEN